MPNVAVFPALSGVSNIIPVTKFLGIIMLQKSSQIKSDHDCFIESIKLLATGRTAWHPDDLDKRC